MKFTNMTCEELESLMLKYDVIIYGTCWTKVVGVEAASQEEAIQKAEDSVNLEELLSGPDCRFAEEVTGYLVDEQGDTNYDNSRQYGPNHLLVHLRTEKQRQLDRLRGQDAWAEFPGCPRDQWAREAGAQDTQIGYWDWVGQQIEQQG